MTSLYTPLLVVHVLAAVLGLGSIASIAVVAGQASVSLSPLFRYSLITLAAMMITGILLDVTAGGAFHGMWWFRLSALLLIVTGALHAQARREAPRRARSIALAMCALIATITVLMELKPFR